MNPICILLATFNGTTYLREQVESIRRQTLKSWRLLIRDDNSLDDTVTLARSLADEDERITIVENTTQQTVGAAQNFSSLLQAGLRTTSSIFFLCDQDDVWEQEKLARQASYFPEGGMERDPLLVHGDLTVVDETLKETHPSFIRKMALDPNPARPLTYLLTRNFATGCTIACNRRLLYEAFPIPQSAIMHDWWLAAVAAGMGEILFINEPLIKYRQHQNNAIGAKEFMSFLKPPKDLVRMLQSGNDEFRQTFEQVHALYLRAVQSGCWEPDRLKMLQDYTSILQLPRFKRLASAKRMGLRQDNAILRLTYYLRLLSIKSFELDDEAGSL